MLFIIGTVVVIGSVVLGYTLSGGHMSTLWMPFEFIIILGAGIGQFITSNSKAVLGGMGKAMGTLIKGPSYNTDSYMELLGVLFSVFKLAKTKGDLALETHVENPSDSSLFQQFPKFAADHHALEFLCDYLRLLTLGTNNPYEVGDVMELELEIHHEEHHDIAGAVAGLGDALPALGIVAAVLGVIHTMGSITEPPEILGELIGGALVGTFFGILVSYGIFTPMSSAMKQSFDADSHYMGCIKAGIVAHMQGYAPQVSVEFARKTLSGSVRPTFAEVEEMIGNIPATS